MLRFFIANVIRDRWCGAYWASKGLRVIPTVNWGDDSTFDFCFEGIEKGSIVAVSIDMASEHDNRQAQKEWFMAGYNEMLRRIEPEKSPAGLFVFGNVHRRTAALTTPMMHGSVWPVWLAAYMDGFWLISGSLTGNRATSVL